MTTTSNAVVEKMKLYFAKQKANVYAIENHPLEQAEEHVQQLYLTMLCVIAQYEKQPTPEQSLFIERLLRGLKKDDSLKDYMAKALTIDDTFIGEFLKQLQNHQLKWLFLVEACMLISGNQPIDSKHIQFVAELAEMLKMTKQQVEAVVKIANGVLMQDSGVLQKVFLELDEFELVLLFQCYYSDFYQGMLIKKASVVHYYGIDETYLDGAAFTTKTIILEACKFDLSNASQVKFEGCLDVQLVNCELHNSENPISFSQCSRVLIENCQFGNFSNRTLKVGSVENVILTNTAFNDCYFTEHIEAIGGVLYFAKVTTLNMEKCHFKNCFVESTYKSYGNAIGVIANVADARTEGILQDNIFESCRCISQDSKGVLFSGKLSQLEIQNNEIIGNDIALGYFGYEEFLRKVGRGC